MVSTVLHSPSHLILLLGIALLMAFLSMTMIANTRRHGLFCKNLDQKQQQIAVMAVELLTLNETCKSLQKEIDIRDLYNGEDDRYLKAINAAKSGLDLGQLMDQFSLIEAEAELIISMHGLKEQAASQ